jgi:hypothetical protein
LPHEVPPSVYLTESLLGRFLSERLDVNVVANQSVPGPGRRLQPDYRSDRHRLIVEFDGDAHYRSTRTIIGDAEQDAFFTGLGYRVIRIPYFVQLNDLCHSRFVWVSGAGYR